MCSVLRWVWSGLKRIEVELCRSLFHLNKYYGLELLDKKLEKYLDLDGGFFVEAGANDGIYYSNTYYFEKFRKWSGLLIEPLPDLCRRCVRNRPGSIVENYALVSPQYQGKTLEIYTGVTWPWLSRFSPFAMAAVKNAQTCHGAAEEHVKKGIRELFGWYQFRKLDVPVITLNELLEKHHFVNIDLLSLDVEGYEYEALQGLDLERYRPRFILIESTLSKQKNKIDQYLTRHYDEIGRLSDHDYLFKRKI